MHTVIACLVFVFAGFILVEVSLTLRSGSPTGLWYLLFFIWLSDCQQILLTSANLYCSTLAHSSPLINVFKNWREHDCFSLLSYCVEKNSLLWKRKKKKPPQSMWKLSFTQPVCINWLSLREGTQASPMKITDIQFFLQPFKTGRREG